MTTDNEATQSTESVERVSPLSHTDVRTYERTEKVVEVDESLTVVTARADAEMGRAIVCITSDWETGAAWYCETCPDRRPA